VVLGLLSATGAALLVSSMPGLLRLAGLNMMDVP